MQTLGMLTSAMQTLGVLISAMLIFTEQISAMQISVMPFLLALILVRL
jgi:hypothetical protein